MSNENGTVKLTKEADLLLSLSNYAEASRRSARARLLTTF